MNKAAVIHEIKQVCYITLFFLLTFTVFLLMKKAFLAQYEIQYYGFLTVLVSSLVLGKVVIILDALAVTKKYDHMPNSIMILFRSCIYLVGYIIVSFIEHGIKALINGEPFGEAMVHNAHHLTSIEGIATLVVLLITFLFFSSFWVLRSHLGPKQLYQLYFGRKEVEAT